MIKFRIIFASTIFSFGVYETSVASEFKLEESMSNEEFQKSGLEKLTKEEITYLNKWVENYNLKDISEIPSPQKITYNEAKAAINAPITTSLTGQFNGWTGNTIFSTTDGGTWKQRTPGRYKISLSSPEVVIKKNFLGFYEMEILETGKKIGVTRLK